jgi:hypothetical protein
MATDWLDCLWMGWNPAFVLDTISAFAIASWNHSNWQLWLELKTKPVNSSGFYWSFAEMKFVSRMTFKNYIYPDL